MKRRTQFRRRWLGPVLVIGVCVAGLVGGFGQSSAAQPNAIAEPAGHYAARPPHSLPLPDTKALVSGVVGLTTTARDTRAKVDVVVPPVNAAAYLDPKYRTPSTQIIPAPSYDLPNHPKAGCNYNAAVLNADLYAVHIKQPNKSKPGVVTNVGRFPASHVAALTFGAIPVTATLHTQQLKRNGKLVPITADTITAFTTTSKKTGASCDPNWESGGSAAPPLGTVSHGELAVRVSDVRVDKQLVDVGPSCHTVTPLQLNLFGRKGYILYTGGVLEQKYVGTHTHADGNTYPLHPGSGNLVIPSFAGCINPETGEDYSPLLTATVSGDSSTLAVHQSTAVLNGISSKDPTLCMSNGKGCVKTPSPVRPPKPGLKVHRHHR